MRAAPDAIIDLAARLKRYEALLIIVAQTSARRDPARAGRAPGPRLLHNEKTLRARVKGRYHIRLIFLYRISILQPFRRKTDGPEPPRVARRDSIRIKRLPGICK
jgi:hypothetical protein